MTEDKDEEKKIEIKRNADGTFSKGYSGNPGGKLKNAQKQIRDFIVQCIPDIMPRMKDIYESEHYPIELRERVMRWMVERIAGKTPDEPPKDDDDTDFKNMSGEKIYALLEFAMQNMPKNQEQQ